MNNTLYVLAVIAAMGAVTWGLRALPFLAAPWLKRHPVVQRLGGFLPLAVMVLLLMHSARGAAQASGGVAWREALAVVVVGAVQWFGRRPLVSMTLGTALYVLLRHAR